MKKRNLAAAVLAAVIAASVPLTGAVNSGLSVTAEAATIGSEEFVFTENEDGTATLALYNGSDAVVVIPEETEDGKKVTAIGEEAFKENATIKSVTIPDSVTSIGESAFYLCNSLESVNLPEGLTSIGSYAFTSCFSLKNITFPESLTMIGPEAFFRCALESVTIPANTNMVSNSFNVCESLTSFEVHPDNEYFSSQDGVLFSKDKTGLVQYPAAKSNTTYAVPEGVTRIYADAFYGAALLENITLPDSLNFIGSAAFYNCTSLKSITIPASVSSLDTFAFDGCSSLAAINVDEANPDFTSVDGVLFNADKTEFLKYPAAKGDKTYEIPEGVTIIKSEAFINCNTLESVVIPEGVTSIEYSAFYRCLALESVTIPTSVTSIGTLAFSFCSALKTVNYAGTDKDWDAIEIGEGNDYLIRAKTGEFPEQPDVPEVTEPVIFTPVIDAEELAKLDDDTKSVLQGITVTDYNGAFDEGVVMNVSFIEKTNGEFTFDITFTKNGAEVQPEDYVTVKIPIPEYLKGGNIYVYHYDDAGKPTRISATIEDGYVVFATRSFSKYSLTNKLISSPSSPSSSAVIVPPPSTGSNAGSGTNSDTNSGTNSNTNTNTNTDTKPDASTDTSSPVSGGTGNPNTGIALAAAPVVLAVGFVIVASKRKK